jgi:arginyl-tRNA synthetase
MLFCPNDEIVDFDLSNVADQSWNNPVFYVQYAHARACSALRDLARACSQLNAGGKHLHTAHLHLLTDKAELSVIRRLSQFPRVVVSAAEGHAPHRIALFLYELAHDFHALWNRSKESPQLRFKVPHDCELMGARTALLAAAAQTMQTGLGLLGVKAVAEMR